MLLEVLILGIFNKQSPNGGFNKAILIQGRVFLPGDF